MDSTNPNKSTSQNAEPPSINDDLSHFRSLPLALPTLNDPSFTQTSISRTRNHDGNSHTLMADTFNTPTTISHLLSFYRAAKTPQNPSSSGDNNSTETSNSNNDDDPTTAELRRFYTFGTGLNAHTNLLHGGVIACLLDSTMGNAAVLAMRDILGTAESLVTVQLNVRYQKPVRTPGSVMARAWATRMDETGRKVWVEGRVVGGERGGGLSCCC